MKTASEENPFIKDPALLLLVMAAYLRIKEKKR